MTGDDIHKLGIHRLIAGYATGTLTEEERRALFAAALDDQELFDQLAREQELKELLEEPGVRERLLTSLAPAPRTQRWWEKAHWSWTAAATAAAILLGVYLSQPSEPKRFAVLLPQPPPVSVAPVPLLTPPPEDQPAPPLPAPAAVARARAGVTAPLPPPPESAARKAVEPTSADRTTAAPKQEQIAQAPPPAPAPLPAPAAAARTITPIPPQALAGVRGGAGGGGRGGAVGGVIQNQFLEKAAAAVFGFDYSVTAEGRLRIVPAANGFLSVSAAGQMSISNRPLAAGAATEVALPDGATSATVVFAAQQIADSILSIVKNPMDAAAGTMSDPNPTPTSRLEAVIPIAPR